MRESKKENEDSSPTLKSEEELKSLLKKVKEETEKPGLKLSIQNTKIMASSPITLRQIEGGKMERVADFIFLGSKITADGDCRHKIKRCISILYWCFSFWLTSFCIIGTGFIHLIRTDSNVFFLMADNTPLCICTTAFLSIHLLMDI